MSGLSSYLGNRYNHYVAAYLKTRLMKYGEGKTIDLREHDFDIEPRIPAESSTFKLPLSLDLVASLSDCEYFAECKYSDNPKPIRASSSEFKEALVEYLGLEKHRALSFRAQIEYLFITNNPTRLLKQDIEKLRMATSSELKESLTALERTAREKWTSFNSSIEEPLVRAVLDRIIVLDIDKGALMESEARPDFQEALRSSVSKVAKRNIAPPFALPGDEASTITATTDENKPDFRETRKLGYTVRVSDTILQEIRRAVQSDAIMGFKQLDEDRLHFLNKLIVDAPKNVPPPAVRRILSEAFNDLAIPEQSREGTFVLVSPEQRVLVLFDRKWLLKQAKVHTNLKGSYQLRELATEFRFTMSNGLLKLAIIEANRLDGIIVDEGWFEEE